MTDGGQTLLMVADVATGKYIEQAQPQKLQPVQVKENLFPAGYCCGHW